MAKEVVKILILYSRNIKMSNMQGNYIGRAN